MKSSFLHYPLLFASIGFFAVSSECSFENRYLDSSQSKASYNDAQKNVVFILIVKSIVAGILTGAAAGMADLRIFPFVGFLTEPVIRKLLLEELFAHDNLTYRKMEIVHWFAWVSSWITWCYMR
jgi:hypothetical protein